MASYVGPDGFPGAARSSHPRWPQRRGERPGGPRSGCGGFQRSWPAWAFRSRPQPP